MGARITINKSNDEQKRLTTLTSCVLEPATAAENSPNLASKANSLLASLGQAQNAQRAIRRSKWVV